MKILKSDHHALSTHRFSRYQSVLGAALLISVGLALSTAPSRAHAEDAVAADATLPTVSVKASADNNAAQADKISAGALGTLKQVDTPFSTHVVTSEEAQDLFANTANDLFQYDPAVSITGTNAIGENSTFNVRGMPIDTLNSIKVDGQSFPSWDTDLAL
jgi:iron complex outermembrane receptor protein